MTFDARRYLAGLDRLFDASALTAPGRERSEVNLAVATRKLVPNRRMHPADWGEANLTLDGMTTTLGGRIKFRMWQRAWLGALVEPGVEEIYVRTCPRAGKSLAIATAMLYVAVHEGDNAIYWERTDTFLQTFHDRMLQPLLASPGVVDHVRANAREGLQDKWHDRYFLTGGANHCRSASTPDGIRQIPGKWLFPDEISAPQYKKPNGGNKVDDVASRGREYTDGRMLAASTCGDDDCAITAGYLRGDQREIVVPCPHCSVTQILSRNVGPDGQKPGKGFKYLIDPETKAVSECWYDCENEACPGEEGKGQPRRIYERHKAWMMDNAEYVAQRPVPNPRIVSFDLWSAHVSDPKVTWWHLCSAHLECVADPSKRRTFHTDWLALKFEQANVQVISHEELDGRAEPYDAEVPTGVRVILWGQDAQRGTDATPEEGGKPPRQEWVAWGWGYGEECWALGRWIVDCATPWSDPSNEELLKLYAKEWLTADGTLISALGGVPDLGYLMADGVSFYAGRKMAELRKGPLKVRAWPAVGGKERLDAASPLVSLTQTNTHHASGTKILRLNQQKGYDALHQRLRVVQPGPQMIHWPVSVRGTGFVKSLTAYSRVRNDKGVIEYKDKPGNEVADTWVYAYVQIMAMLRGLRDAIVALQAGIQPNPITAGVQSDDGHSVRFTYADGDTLDVELPAGPVKRWRGDRTFGETYLAGEALLVGPDAYAVLLDHTVDLYDPQPDIDAGRIALAVRGGRDTVVPQGVYQATRAYKTGDGVYAQVNGDAYATWRASMDLSPGIAPGQTVDYVVVIGGVTYHIPMPAWERIGASTLRELDFRTLASKPAAGEVVVRKRLRTAYNILGGLSGCSAYLETVPTQAIFFSVRRNGIEIGRLNFAAGAKEATLSGPNGMTSCAAGDRISVVAPAAQDSTAADLSGYVLLSVV